MKYIGYILAGAIATLGFAPSAYAFHSGGVAECEGCHSMHNSFENKPNVTGMPQFSSGPFLLKAQDQSGACLNCHNQPDVAPTGYHISTDGSKLTAGAAPVEWTPGGDFGWLKLTRTGKVRGQPVTWEGDRQGHNIIATDFGYGADKVQTVAPGGTYPASALACSSCHDPHGTYRRLADGTQVRGGIGATTSLPIFGSGSYGADGTAAGGSATQGGPAYPVAGVSAAGVYRILGGVGYQPKSLTGSYAFVNPAPDAVAPSTYNKLETDNLDPTKQVIVAYGRGMSEWCSNCHTKMHEDSYTSGTKGLVHPVGNGAKLTAAVAANYNAYVSSGKLTNTGASFSTLAPFEIGVADSLPATYTALKAFITTPTPAGTTSNVACVSCHRAHASAFESATRYYLGNEFMTIADGTGAAIYDGSTTENKINTAYNVAQQVAAYGGRPATAFGPYARNYCNKCHAKD